MSTPGHTPFVVRLSNHGHAAGVGRGLATRTGSVLRVPQDERVAGAGLRARGACLKTAVAQRTGSAEGRSPFAGGTGVSPVIGFTPPFLARKGDRGMVETAVGRRRLRVGAEVSKNSLESEKRQT